MAHLLRSSPGSRSAFALSFASAAENSENVLKLLWSESSSSSFPSRAAHLPPRHASVAGGGSKSQKCVGAMLELQKKRVCSV